MKRKRDCIVLLIIMGVFFTMCLPVCSFAGGAQHYPLGSEGHLMGMLPPSGFYTKTYFYYYGASDLKDNSGDTMRVGKHGAELDHLDVYAITPRFIWISEKKILGMDYAQHLFVPLVKQDMKLDTFGGGSLHEDRFSLADIRYSPIILGWHSKGGLLHTVAALNFDIPTGSYRSDHFVNIGKNCWSISPGFAFTAFLPQNPKFSLSMFLQYAFNTSNDDYIIGASQAAKIGNMALTGTRTHLTPGQEFMFDYSIDYGFTKDFRAGITGYYYQQTTNDKTGLGTIKNDKGKVFAIGPGAVYSYKNFFFDFHINFETMAKNRPQGVQSVFSIVYAFDKPKPVKKEETK